MRLQQWTRPPVGFLVFLLAACASSPPDENARNQLRQIPMRDDDGSTVMLAARVCRPAGQAPARVVVINHGSPPNASARPRMDLQGCSDEASQWFLTRGYIVVYAMRRGYGDTGGHWAETYGSCADPDYYDAGLETARDIDAIVNDATSLPFARHDGAIVVGQSAGGWGTIAYSSQPHPKVAGFVVMAGGRGGHRHDVPNVNCRPDVLADAAARYGASARTPMLWIYALNDSYFAPPIAEAIHDGFIKAGGSAVFLQPPAYDGDGHHLFFGEGGSVIWGPPVQHYLESIGAGPD